MNDIIYLLYYDIDDDSRESWSVFYTPCEAFATEGLREKRMEFLLKQINPETDEPWEFDFHLSEICLNSGDVTFSHDFEEDSRQDFNPAIGVRNANMGKIVD